MRACLAERSQHGAGYKLTDLVALGGGVHMGEEPTTGEGSGAPSSCQQAGAQPARPGARPGGTAGEGPSGLLSGPARDFAPSTSSNLGIRRRDGRMDGRMDGWLPSRLRPWPLEYCYSSTFGNTQNSFLLKTTHIIEVLKLQDSPWCRGWSLDTSEKFPCSSFYILCFALSKPSHR